MSEFNMAGAHPWMKKAYDHGIRTNGWFEVKMGSLEDKSWREYFGGLGWTPWVVRSVESLKNKSYTMPCQWPDWLPTDFEKAWGRRGSSVDFGSRL